MPESLTYATPEVTMVRLWIRPGLLTIESPCQDKTLTLLGEPKRIKVKPTVNEAPDANAD